MQIIRIDKTESTSLFLKSLHLSRTFEEPVCLVTDQQTSGRGQQGTSWQSAPHKNLTFSILYPSLNIEIQHQFKLNMLVALSILRYLSTLNIPRLSLKWPNDIMADHHKVGGLLIENSISMGLLKYSLIGIGLNVNQTEFKDLPKASSLSLKTNKDFDLELLLKALTNSFENYTEQLKSRSFDAVRSDYEAHLFKKGKVSAFKMADGRILNGIIFGVNENGQLLVETDDDVVKAFSLKEVRLLF